ncbi:hypothetical protein FQR65_LT17734 [Abscondita terminalis]|nr:hypothetical protein FQR65_LT17734 [Abscondita terminalis]
MPMNLASAPVSARPCDPWRYGTVTAIIPGWLTDVVVNSTGVDRFLGLQSVYGRAQSRRSATEDAKPDGKREVEHGLEKDYLAPLRIERMPGIGTNFRLLHQKGVRNAVKVLMKFLFHDAESFGTRTVNRTSLDYLPVRTEIRQCTPGRGVDWPASAGSEPAGTAAGACCRPFRDAEPGGGHVALLGMYSTLNERGYYPGTGQSIRIAKGRDRSARLHTARMALRDKISAGYISRTIAETLFPNHLSVHAGGVLISEKPICHSAAVELRPKIFRTISIWICLKPNGVGLFKFDILSREDWDIIKDALQLIEDNTGKHIDIHQVERFF